MERLLRDNCRLGVIPAMDHSMAYMFDLLAINADVPLETVQKVNERRFMIANRGFGLVLKASGCLTCAGMLKGDPGWGRRDGRDSRYQEEA